MVTYYTALGRLITRAENGVRNPVVVIDDREYNLSDDELMVWVSLHWNFLNWGDLEKEYNRRRNIARIFNDCSFRHVVDRLVQRKMITSGTDYLAADALYNLVGELRIRPIRFGVLDRVKSCAVLYFTKGIPLNQCIAAYFGTELSQNEKKILQLSEHAGVTTAEIIQCAEKNITTIQNEEDIMDELYADEQSTAQTIFSASRFSQLKIDVLQAVTNLYLKKKIIFE